MFPFNLDWYSLLAIALAGVASYMLLSKSLQGPRKGLDARMLEFAAKAVVQAKNEHQMSLDFSVDSVAMVDEILETYHQRHRGVPIPERELSQIVLTWGGYVGTALQGQVGGVWKADSPRAGLNTYPLCLESAEAIPVIWCLQRIRRGDQENVAKKAAEFIAAQRRQNSLSTV